MIFVVTFVVTFRFRGKSEVQKRVVRSIKIDGKGALILYDKDRGITENLTLAELRDLSIESVRTRSKSGNAVYRSDHRREAIPCTRSHHTMVFCDQPTLEKWSPDFSTSGLSNPLWTRVKYSGVELCNSLEWADWTVNPVQVQICDACGTLGCASGGYVHVSTLQDVVLWTGPQCREIIEPVTLTATATERFGSVMIPRGVWDSFRSVSPEVADFGR